MTLNTDNHITIIYNKDQYSKSPLPAHCDCSWDCTPMKLPVVPPRLLPGVMHELLPDALAIAAAAEYWETAVLPHGLMFDAIYK